MSDDDRRELAAFTVSADWLNDGTASLAIGHRCGWWHDSGHDYAVTATLAELIESARNHLQDCHE